MYFVFAKILIQISKEENGDNGVNRLIERQFGKKR
jgi:hypothetical protein